MSDMLDIPCPECGHKKKLSLDDLNRHPSFVCGKCRKHVTVDGRGFIRKLDATVKDAAKELSKTLKLK